MMKVEFSRLPYHVEPNLLKIIHTILPLQGAVEIQQDQPGKVHSWHSHTKDETLLVLQGGMDFYYDDNVRHCVGGDIIHLSSMLQHQSIAGDQGCIYLIAGEIVRF